eukprot:gene27591-31180_t
MSALGSCTAMTIRTVFEKSKALAGSKQKDKSPTANGLGGWAESTLDEIRVKVQEWGNHPHVPDRLSVHVELIGKLTEEQKSSLLKASSNCPVKIMLTKGVRVDSTLVSGNE